MSRHPVPVGQPLPGASLGQATARFFRGYVHFSGRASRSEFWWAMLAMLILCLVPAVPMMVVAIAMDPPSSLPRPVTSPSLLPMLWLFIALLIVSMLVALAVTPPAYAVMWRRLQDANVHGAWMLLCLVGLSIVPLVICCFRSEGISARARGGSAPQRG